MLERRLDSLLASIASSVNYHRAVLMFLDESRTISASMVGVHPRFREAELRGTSGKGYSDLHEGHPAQVAIQCGVPFHTCLSAKFIASEFSGPSGTAKMKYYQQLETELTNYRKARFAHLKSRHLLPEDFSLDDFVATQDKNYDIFLEQNPAFESMYESYEIWVGLGKDELILHYQLLKEQGEASADFDAWRESERIMRKAYDVLKKLGLRFADLFPDFDAYASVDPLIGRRHGFSREQYCNTLLLGVRVQDKLIAVAQFDYPIGVRDFTTPLPLERQLGAQAKLQQFVPGIVLEGAVHSLQIGQPSLAEKTLDLLGSDHTIVIQYHTDSANTILLPEPSVTGRNLSAAYCIKRFSVTSRAAVEATVRSRIGEEKAVKTFPAIGYTDRHLVSPTRPNISLYRFLCALRGADNENIIKGALLEQCIATTRRIQDVNMTLPSIETDYATKLGEVMTLVLGPAYDADAIHDTSDRLTRGWLSDTRKQDAAPRNVCLGLEELALAYELPLPDSAERMNAPAWNDDVSQFIAELREPITNNPSRLIEAWRLIEYRADFETMSRMTYSNDDIIELVDAPVWMLSMREREAYMASITPQERLYRNMRWLLYIGGWIDRKEDGDARATLIQEEAYHKRTIIECIAGMEIENRVLRDIARVLARDR